MTAGFSKTELLSPFN